MTEPKSDQQTRYEKACERRAALYQEWEDLGSPLLSTGSKGQEVAHPLFAELGRMDARCDKLDPNRKARRPGRTAEAQIRPRAGEGEKKLTIRQKMYAKLGPAPSSAFRYCAGDTERAERMLLEWKTWRAEFGDRFDAGEDVPTPPHSETLGN